MSRMRSDLLPLYTCLLGACLLTAAPAAAQVTTSIGVQGGLNVVNVDHTSAGVEAISLNFKSRTRVVFGALVAWDFNPKSGLQIDALYSQKGSKFEFVDEDGTETRLEARIDYLEFPVLIRANLPASDTVKVRLFAGPAFSFKVSDDATTTVDGQEEPDEDPSFTTP